MARIVSSCLLSLVAAVFTACGSSPSSTTSSIPVFEGRGHFPQHPHSEMTPGEKCQRASSYRYAEHIPYCERDVSSETKRSIIAQYDREFGYTIGQMERTEFKIDHFIPLCMGGSNATVNLWPQHKTVYEITDEMEGSLCQLMASGELKQAEAIETLSYAKFHLDEVPRIMDDVRSRLSR